MALNHYFFSALMLEELLSIIATIPDSFNNCSTYFYEEFKLAQKPLCQDSSILIS